IKRSPATVDVKIVRLQEGMLDDTTAPVVLELNPHVKLKMKDYQISKEEGRVRFDWKGEGVTESVTLSIRDKCATGLVYTGNKVFSVEPLGDGLEAVTQLDQTKYPQDKSPPEVKENKKD